MKISMIAAVSNNGVIGVGGTQLPWSLPDDFAWFQEKTHGKAIIMGRRTWESLPRRPLRFRLNIVISRGSHLVLPGGVRLAHSLEEALGIAEREEAQEAVIIGGTQVYLRALELDLPDVFYLTSVDVNIGGENVTRFPFWETSRWQKTSPPIAHSADDRHAHPFIFHTLHRKR